MEGLDGCLPGMMRWWVEKKPTLVISDTKTNELFSSERPPIHGASLGSEIRKYETLTSLGEL